MMYSCPICDSDPQFLPNTMHTIWFGFCCGTSKCWSNEILKAKGSTKEEATKNWDFKVVEYVESCRKKI